MSTAIMPSLALVDEHLRLHLDFDVHGRCGLGPGLFPAQPIEVFCLNDDAPPVGHDHAAVDRRAQEPIGHIFVGEVVLHFEAVLLGDGFEDRVLQRFSPIDPVVGVRLDRGEVAHAEGVVQHPASCVGRKIEEGRRLAGADGLKAAIRHWRSPSLCCRWSR